MINISDLREEINELLPVYRQKKRELSKKLKERKILMDDLRDNEVVRSVYQEAALATQNYIESNISAIVTNALRSVFYEKDIEFKVSFVRRRNTTECDLSLLDGGEEYNILDDKGFGIADICSFALHVAYILLDDVDKVLIIDEPFRNLDRERAQYASQMVSELSKKLDIQFIISTHIIDLVEYADKIIKVRLIRKDTSEILHESIRSVGAGKNMLKQRYKKRSSQARKNSPS